MSEQLESARKLIAIGIAYEQCGDVRGEEAVHSALEHIASTSTDIHVLAEIAIHHAEHDKDGEIDGLNSEYERERSLARLLFALCKAAPVTETPSARDQLMTAIAAEIAVYDAAMDGPAGLPAIPTAPVTLLNPAI